MRSSQSRCSSTSRKSASRISGGTSGASAAGSTSELRGRPGLGVSRRGAHGVPFRATRPTAGRRPRARTRRAPACRSARGSRAARRAGRSPPRRRARRRRWRRPIERAASCSTSSRDVRATDARIVSRSSGQRVRRSTTSIEASSCQLVGGAQREVDARAVRHDREIACRCARRAPCRSARGDPRPAPRRAVAGRAPCARRRAPGRHPRSRFAAGRRHRRRCPGRRP